MTRDPGLQPERTRLAWHRTGVATVLVGCGAALAAARREATGVLMLAVLACAVVGLVTAVGGRSRVDAPYGRIVLGAAATIAVAVVGVVLALV